MKAHKKVKHLTFPGQDDDVLIAEVDECWWWYTVDTSELVPMTEDMIIDELKAIVQEQDALIRRYEDELGVAREE